MRIGTIFSGCGAPEQAAARVWQGHEVAFACEWDKYARQSYLANYEIDETHFHKDVKELDGTQYRGKVDVLIGGSPCQAFSIAGLRNGTDDERGQLIYQYVRVVDEVKAPVIVYEYVKGMLSIDGGRTIKEFVEALREIGYYCHYEVLNTKDYGVPQNRERIFLVGFLDHEAYYRFSFAPKVKLEKRLKDVLEPSVDEKYYLSETAIKGFSSHAERMAERGNGFKFDPTDGNTIASSVTTRAGGRPDDNFVKEQKSEIEIIGELDRKGEENQRRIYGTNGVAPSLRAGMGEGGGITPKIMEPKILDLTNDFGEGKTREYTEFAPTLRSERFGLATKQNYRIRKLTPRECLRLQDFPDTFKQVVSDSQMYKQAGNAMSCNVVEMVFRCINDTLKGKTPQTRLF